VIEIRDGSTREWTIDPARFGFPVGRVEELAGGPPDENAAAVLAVLEGRAPPTARAAVLLNAAAALYVSGLGEGDFEGSLARVQAALDDGAGMAALERLRRAFAPPQ
jgi:anthranilate phosphoribosyltransferase